MQTFVNVERYVYTVWSVQCSAVCVILALPK